MHRTKLLPLAMIMGFMVHSNMTIAAEKKWQAMVFKNNDPATSAQYWTPERMQQATPMDLPKADARTVRKISLEEMKQKHKGLISEVRLGSPPSFYMTPEANPLFKPVMKEDASPLDEGALGELFTSQQLLPLSADQSYPYTTVGKLFFTDNSGNNKTCSASVIGKRIVLTAGHCMHNGNGSSTGWFNHWTFVPAYRDGNAPFLLWNFSASVVSNDWYVGGGTVPNAGDYGMLVFADQSINGTIESIGNVVGTLGFQTLSTIPNHAHLLGYPGNLDGGTKMHQVTAQSAIAVAPNNAEYGSDMSLGSGGGPWIQNFGPASVGQAGGTNPMRNLVIGLSSYGYNDTVSLAEGSSILDSNFVSLFALVCGLATGNC